MWLWAIVAAVTLGVRKVITASELEQRTGELALKLGIPRKFLAAVVKVESAGSETAVRFEPHHYLRYRPMDHERVPFTDGGRGFSTIRRETNRKAFEHAFAISPDAAVRSTSFGRYQVLGGKLIEVTGLPAREAFAAWEADPERWNDAMLMQWFKDTPAGLRAAQAKDVRAFVRAYNGPKNVDRYSELLLEAGALA